VRLRTLKTNKRLSRRPTQTKPWKIKSSSATRRSKAMMMSRSKRLLPKLAMMTWRAKRVRLSERVQYK